MLPTQKLYQTVDRTQYDAVKQDYFSGLSTPYSGLQDPAKWAFLMGEFTRLFPDERQTVSAFQQARLNTVPTATTISLRDCLNYFEQFYFLYTTTDPLFQLNSAEKAGLKRDVLEGMNGSACDPGKQERFDLALVLYRRDTHWINGHLSQARYHVLERLAESCNIALDIGNGMSPHTIKFMKSLAEEKRLGIDREVALTDAYRINTAGITTYFATHYSAAYREFEANAADDLARSLLNECTDFLTGKTISMVEWDQEELVIPLEHHTELFAFFGNKSFNAIMDDLGGNSDDDQLRLKRKGDFFIGLQSLVRKKLLQDEYYVSLSVPNERPAADAPSLPAWHAGVSMHDVLDFKRALQSEPVDFFTLFNQYEAVIFQYPQMVLRFIATKPEILLALPGVCRIKGLFIGEVITAVNAALLAEIAAGNDHEKIKQLIGCLLTYLPTSHDDFSKFDTKVLNHPSVAVALVKRCGLLLKQMSLSTRNNPLIVGAAMEQNGLALCFASDRLQRDVGLIQSGLDKLTVSFGAVESEEADNYIPYPTFVSAILGWFYSSSSWFNQVGAVELEEVDVLTPYQTRIADIYIRCKNQLPPFAQPEFEVDVIPAFGYPDLIHARLKAIQKMKALHVLCGAPFVGALKLATLAQNLTPTELVKVIQYREDQAFSVLPYCDHLEAFCQNLDARGCNWLEGGYEAAKQQAQAVLDAPEMDAVGYLARTNHWYMALVQHHRAHQLEFKTMTQFLQQLQKTIKVTLEFMWLFLKFTAFCFIFFSIPLIIFLCITFFLAFFEEVFINVVLLPMVFAEAAFFGVASIALIVIIYFIHIVAVALIIGAICGMISPIVEPVFRYIVRIGDKRDRFITGEWTLLHESMQTLATQVYSLMKGIHATVFSPEAPPLPTDTLAARCERSIERLMFTKEDASANQKGALLSTLWDKVQEEEPCASEDVLKGCLNKQYEVSYQGRARQVSFFEVASTKRASSDRFQLDEPSSVFGFFSKACATTTDSMLDCTRVYE